MTKIGRNGAQRSTITSVYIDFCQMNVIGGVELFVCFSEQNNSIFYFFALLDMYLVFGDCVISVSVC